MFKNKKLIVFPITICLLIIIILIGISKNNQSTKVIQSPKKNYTETRGITLPDLNNIGVTLYVNGVDVAHRYRGPSGYDVGCSSDLNQCTLNLQIPVNGLVPEQSIPMVIKAQNTETSVPGLIARATILKYWMDANGNRLNNEDPSLIEIEYDNQTNWVKDEESSTTMRTVLYYNRVLYTGDESLTFTKSIKLNENAFNVSCDPTYENGVYHSNCTNNGKNIGIEVNIDFVESDNCESSVRFAFGLSSEAIDELGICSN